MRGVRSMNASHFSSKLFAGKKPYGVFGVLLVLLCMPALAAMAQPAIPAKYQAIYSTLEADMNAFEPTLDALMPADPRRIDMFAELLTANTNQGTSMLGPYAIEGVRTNLDRLKDIGVTGIVFPVSFPILLPEYVTDASAYLAFYTNVASEVRQRDMKLVVKLHSIFPGSTSAFGFNYDNLTFAKYKDGKKSMAQTIINTLRPDYLTIINELTSEASVTGLAELNDPAKAQEFVAYTLAGLNKRTTLVGAGSGTWDRPEFIRDYLAGMANLDFIDLHVYPINNMDLGDADYLAQLLTYIDNARSVNPNKKVVMTEAWLYKASDSEVGAINSAFSPRIYARDAYSFWMPLDQAFLRTITKAASLKELTFMSAFWSRYFFAYADYNPTIDSWAPSRLLQYASKLAQTNMQNRIYSPTGTYYTELISEYGIAQRSPPPPPANSTIQIFAEGTPAFGEYPTMVVRINDIPVKTYTNISSYQTYTFVHTTNVTPNQVKISYVNDATDRTTGNDRNLRVDKIVIDGAPYETEAGTTISSTSYYTGFPRSEWMNYNGYFLYDQLPSAPFPIPVPDTAAPIINILTPANNTTVAKGTAVVITATAFDYTGLAKVEFMLNGAIRCGDGYSPYTCNLTLPSHATGSYTIQAQAYDLAGNTAATSIVIHTR